MAAPTLTYQVAYPRTPKIRYKWLARRVAEAVVTAALLVFLIQQARKGCEVVVIV